MRNFERGILFVAIITLAFFFAGCEKKKVEQVGEITPPQQQGKEITPETPAGGQDDIAMPGAKGGGAQDQGVPATGLKGDAAAFEQNDIHFDYDSFSIRDEDQAILAEKASYLNANPGVKIRIV